MPILAFGATMMLALFIAYRFHNDSAGEVEKRAMRSLKNTLRRDQITPQRRLIALSRMM